MHHRPIHSKLAGMSEGPVTIYISRRFKPGTEAAVQKWTEEIRVCCATFPGFLGAVTLEPHGLKTDTCHFIFRFSNFANLRRWEESPERADFHHRLQPLLEEEHIARLSGFEPWFPPGSTGSIVPPPKWKMWLMAQLAVFPTVLLVRYLLVPFLMDLPIALNVFIACIPVSFLMSFFAMPWITRIFQKWLYPPAN